MAERRRHRKQVKHYHEPGDLHELTFSCYRRMPLLTNDGWRGYLAKSCDEAFQAEPFQLVAFVFMPEHVHLLLLPSNHDPELVVAGLSRCLACCKRRCSVQVKQDLISAKSPLLKKLVIRERPGKVVFRYWQEGPGYDRNLRTRAAVLAAIDYIHMNPVRRGLCAKAVDWRWSSAKWYATDGHHQDPALPRIDALPAEFFGSGEQ